MTFSRNFNPRFSLFCLKISVMSYPFFCDSFFKSSFLKAKKATFVTGFAERKKNPRYYHLNNKVKNNKVKK